MSINEGCMEMTLNSPITEEQWDAITDVDFEHTNKIRFHTKHGKDVEFAKVVHGHWEMKWHILFHQELPACSCCGKFVVTANLYTTNFMYTYCPLCGAKMDEVTE